MPVDMTYQGPDGLTVKARVWNDRFKKREDGMVFVWAQVWQGNSFGFTGWYPVMAFSPAVLLSGYRQAVGDGVPPAAGAN